MEDETKQCVSVEVEENFFNMKKIEKEKYKCIHAGKAD